MPRVSRTPRVSGEEAQRKLTLPARTRYPGRIASRGLSMMSLTGGGYRGLFTAQVLVHLCDHAGTTGPLHTRFDVFAGTSIGGLLACALAVGVPPRRVVDAIDAHGKIVFPPKPASGLRRLIFGSLYEKHHLAEAIHAALGPAALMPMADVSVGLIVPAVDWSRGQVRLFMSGAFGRAHADPTSLVDVCLATSAAPTYFPPHTLGGRAMLDGGLAANNPDALALLEVARRWPHRLGTAQMLSIGTAGAVAHRDGRDAAASGLRLGPLLPEFMIDLQERSAEEQARRVLGERYLRINHQADPDDAAFTHLDRVTPGIRQRLLDAASDTAALAYRHHRDFIDRVLAPLTAGSDGSGVALPSV
jgi:uncharacterized protein